MTEQYTAVGVCEVSPRGMVGRPCRIIYLCIKSVVHPKTGGFKTLSRHRNMADHVTNVKLNVLEGSLYHLKSGVKLKMQKPCLHLLRKVPSADLRHKERAVIVPPLRVLVPFTVPRLPRSTPGLFSLYQSSLVPFTSSYVQARPGL